MGEVVKVTFTTFTNLHQPSATSTNLPQPLPKSASDHGRAHAPGQMAWITNSSR